jgi:hypothetical protein
MNTGGSKIEVQGDQETGDMDHLYCGVYLAWNRMNGCQRSFPGIAAFFSILRGRK